MIISKQEAANVLLKKDNFLILAHSNPDGDAVGSACALCHALRSMGKTAFVSIEEMSRSVADYATGLVNDGFSPDYIISTDTAEKHMLGIGKTSLSKDCKVDLCIDHHMSNTDYAKNTCVDASAAAACEVIYDIIKLMNAEISLKTAECIYLGISTDTGCFRYSNTTAKTFRIAAEAAEIGINIASINKIQFETKSKEYAEMEKMAISSMQTYLNGKLAVITLTNDMFVSCGVKENEIQAISALPRQIEGVLIGITLKEKEKGTFKMSIRTNDPINASLLAESFGGGGHKNAAGGSFKGKKNEALDAVISVCEKSLKDSGII